MEFLRQSNTYIFHKRWIGGSNSEWDGDDIFSAEYRMHISWWKMFSLHQLCQCKDSEGSGWIEHSFFTWHSEKVKVSLMKQRSSKLYLYLCLIIILDMKSNYKRKFKVLKCAFSAIRHHYTNNLPKACNGNYRGSGQENKAQKENLEEKTRVRELSLTWAIQRIVARVSDRTNGDTKITDIPLLVQWISDKQQWQDYTQTDFVHKHSKLRHEISQNLVI